MRWMWAVAWLASAAASQLTCVQYAAEQPTVEETCKASHGQVAACYAVWTYRNGSSGARLMRIGGCWSSQDGSECEAAADSCVARSREKGGHYFCCCTGGSHCNSPKHLRLTLDPKTEPEPTEEPPAKPEPLLTALYILLPLLLIALLAICAYWLVRRAQYYAMRRKQEAEEAGRGLDATQLGALSSGSGSLGQHRPIQLRHVVARGRFGHVYLADWAEKPVAVKIFPAADVDSWMQEQDIYAVEGMRSHENVLRFLCAEEWSEGGGVLGGPEYWLVTEYHPRGSLSDFLKVETLSECEMLRVVATTLRGLAFLHEELEGRGSQPRKPTIVHRDLKSKNILLKHDLTAAISDFGLAMRCSQGRTTEDTHGQVGTRRYMAPEVLEGATEFTAFAFRQIDIYAAALVLWECIARTRLPPPSLPPDAYKLPFEEEVGAHPTLAEMQSVVVSEKRRPTLRSAALPPRSAALALTLEEMWDAEPEARITAGCALERVLAIMGPAASSHLASYCDPQTAVPAPGKAALEHTPLLISDALQPARTALPV